MMWIGISCLLAALRRHAGANLVEEPFLKRFPGFDGAATDDERVGIEDVDHLVEEQPERVGLNLKDAPTERVAAFREAAHSLGRLMRRRAPVELVVRVARQKIRKDRAFNRRQRAQRLEVARAETVALRTHALDAGDRLIRNEDVSQLPAESPATANDGVAGRDHAAAESRPDDRGDRRRVGGRTEDRDVAPERRRVAIVEIDHATAELLFEAVTDVEPRPIGVDEIRGAAGAEHAVRGCRTGRVETHHGHVRQRYTGPAGRERQPVGDLLKADGGALLRFRRMLEETVNEKAALLVNERVVDGRASQIHTRGNAHRPDLPAETPQG